MLHQEELLFYKAFTHNFDKKLLVSDIQICLYLLSLIFLYSMNLMSLSFLFYLQILRMILFLPYNLVTLST